MTNSFAPAALRHDIQILKTVDRPVDKNLTLLAKRRAERALWTANWQICGEYLRKSKDSFKRIRIADRPDFPFATYRHKSVRCWLEEADIYEINTGDHGYMFCDAGNPVAALAAYLDLAFFEGKDTIAQKCEAACQAYKTANARLTKMDYDTRDERLQLQQGLNEARTRKDVFTNMVSLGRGPLGHVLTQSGLSVQDLAQKLMQGKVVIHTAYDCVTTVSFVCSDYDTRLAVVTKTLGYDYVLDLKERGKYACIYDGVWEIRQFDSEKFEFGVVEPSSDDIAVHNLAKNNDGDWVQEPIKVGKVCHIYD